MGQLAVVKGSERRAAEGGVAQVVAQELYAHELAPRKRGLVHHFSPRIGTKSFEREHGRAPAILDGRSNPKQFVPVALQN